MRFELRKLFLVFLVIAHLLAFVGLYLFHQETSHFGFESNLPIFDFEMENQDGKLVSKNDLKGNFLFVYFGFLHCTDVCPKAMGMLDSLSRKEKSPDIRFVFVSIDPERDTQNKLATYIQSRDSRFIGLRNADPVKVQDFARQFKIWFFRKDFTENPKSNYQIPHQNSIFLVDSSFQKVIVYPEGLHQPDRILEDLQKWRKSRE